MDEHDLVPAAGIILTLQYTSEVKCDFPLLLPWIYSVLILNLLTQNAAARPSPMTGDTGLSSILIINS
jgi:hypothetical protein